MNDCNVCMKSLDIGLCPVSKTPVRQLVFVAGLYHHRYSWHLMLMMTAMTFSAIQFFSSLSQSTFILNMKCVFHIDVLYLHYYCTIFIHTFTLMLWCTYGCIDVNCQKVVENACDIHSDKVMTEVIWVLLSRMHCL